MGKYLSVAVLVIFLSFPKFVSAQQGCCYQNDGVDYCDTNVGYLVCKDGSYSETCSCPLITGEVTPTQEDQEVMEEPTPTITKTATPIQTPAPNSNVSATPAPTVCRVKSAVVTPTLVPTPQVKAAKTQNDKTLLLVFGLTVSLLAIFSGGYLIYWGWIKK